MSSTKIASLIDSRSSEKNIATKIASYLIDTKQTLQLDSLMRDVMNEREAQGIYELSVVSAHPLDQTQLASIKSYMKKHFTDCKEVIIHQNVDPSLLGGVRIESANYLIDRTLKNKLNHIKSSIDS